MASPETQSTPPTELPPPTTEAATTTSVDASAQSEPEPQGAPAVATPRTHRVPRPSLGILSPPPLTTSVSSPPVLPARSPLRPPTRSLSQASTPTRPNRPTTSSNTSTVTLDSPLLPETPQDVDAPPNSAKLPPDSSFRLQMRERHNSIPSLDGLIDPLLAAAIDDAATSAAMPPAVVDLKSLPAHPDSPPRPTFDDSEQNPTTNPETPPSTATSSAAASVSSAPTLTKRQHALHEILSSERAYASDLALIRDVHIPLALGLSVPLTNIPSPPTSSSSGSSSRTHSTASDSSTASLGPPMTQDDTKIIFGNVTELALFADMFSEELELALGAVVEGGEGEDTVGALFLRIIPDLERPYKHYITRHPTALQHLHSLPQTPALTAYLTHTQTIASALSHAWDLASLLIKPVQRLLKYPLLLGAIIDETPDSHPDKENLRLARARMEEVARNVNEGRRRAEVVKDVLSSKTPKKPNANVTLSASVNLSKMKSLRHGGVTAATMRVSQLSDGGSSEAAQVEAYQAELRRIDVYAQQFARDVVDWGKMMARVMGALRVWAQAFGKVIGLSADQGSEAFDAFLDVITKGLMPSSADLELVLNERVLRDLAHLLTTMNQPLKLLASMNEQEPYHYHLLTMPVSAKNRPPPSLLAASTNYLALRGQLASELPAYLALMHRGLAVLVRRLAEVQTRWWRDVRDRWAELWEMLRVEGELNVGWEETSAVWCARWADVDEVVRGLGIVGQEPHVLIQQVIAAQALRRAGAQKQAIAQAQAHLQQGQPQAQAQQYNMEEYFAYPEFFVPASSHMQTPATQYSPPREREREKDKEKDKDKNRDRHNSRSSGSSANAAKVAAATVQTMFAALEPAHSPRSVKPQSPSNNQSGGGGSSVYQAGSVFGSSVFGLGGGHAAASTYSVSAPMPLAAGAMYAHGHRDRTDREGGRERDRGRESGRRGRGRGLTVDADMRTMASGMTGASGTSGSSGSTGAYPGSTSTPNAYGYGYASPTGLGRRTTSQDSLRSRRREEKEREREPLRSPSSPNGPGGAAGNLGRRRTHGHTGLADEFAEYVQHMPGGFSPPAYEGNGNGNPPSSPRSGIPRTKSMPLGRIASTSEKEREMGLERDKSTRTARPTTSSAQPTTNGGSYAVDPEPLFYQPPRTAPAAVPASSVAVAVGGEEGWGSAVQRQDSTSASTRTRGRESGSRPSTSRGTAPMPPPASPLPPTPQPASTSASRAASPSSGKRKSRERPTHQRNRSGSVKSITSFFTGSNTNTNRDSPPPDPQPLTASQRDSWASKPSKYICQVIHPCKPPPTVSYYSFPFFTLQVDDLYHVLQEAGHPSIHPKLPLYVDDGEDCLLLCRDMHGIVGWALASFLEPLPSS